MALVASDRRWLPYPHLMRINDALWRLAHGKTKRLIVEVPPQHGKSHLVSKYFPAWFLCRWPDKHVILASYGAELATTWGRRTREVINQVGSYFGVQLRDDSRAADRWEVSGREGGMMAAGVRGPVTGFTGDLLIIDDPVKNEAEAMSKVYREGNVDWYHSSAESRLSKEAGVVIAMARWHSEDLAGYLESYWKGSDLPYEKISMPAEAVQDEDWGDWGGRKKGEALCPDLHPTSQFAPLKTKPYWWASLWQQQPVPPGERLIKKSWFRYYRLEGRVLKPVSENGNGSLKPISLDSCYVFTTADLALTQKASSDFTCVCVWAFHQESGCLFLLDLTREKIEGPDILPLIKQMAGRWDARISVIESVQFQALLVQQAVRDGFPAVGVQPDKSKKVRLIAATPRLSVGHTFFPDGAPWLGEFEYELLSFTGDDDAGKDDQVDNLSLAEAALSDDGVLGCLGPVDVPDVGSLGIGSRMFPSSGGRLFPRIR